MLEAVGVEEVYSTSLYFPLMTVKSHSHVQQQELGEECQCCKV